LIIDGLITIAPILSDWRSGPVKIENVREYAQAQIKPDQWICLDELWQRESSWQTKRSPHLAVNRSSGAYGIPQALPASKMASAGRDWRYNPKTQIDWGLDYINKRYGSSCKALDHHNRKGWYS